MILKYNLGGLMFSSKLAVSQYARRIKDTAPIGEPLEGQPLDFMFDLLRWHKDAPKKIGSGVRSIEVRLNPTFKHREFYLWRTDGTGTEFSYRQCTTPSSSAMDFASACREAVTPDIIAFRNKALMLPIRCPITGEPLDQSNSHVDHEPPTTFAKLLVDFARAEKIDPRKVAVTGRHMDNSYSLQLADAGLRSRWIIYHQQNANLRLISKTANLRIVGSDWDIILRYLVSVAHTDVLIEWKGKRWFYTQPEHINRGIFMLPERAPEDTPVIDGAIILIEASFAEEAKPHAA